MLLAADAIIIISDAVNRCGGAIKIESTKPNGIAISISLPVNQAVTTSNIEASRRIVVVDDDAEMRQFVSDTLTAAGYDVTLARSGDEAMHLCEKHQATIQLVIADVVMPHLSGRQLASKLGNLHPDTKVLLMSGYPNVTGFFDGIVGRAEPVKVEFNFLQKPFSPAVLIQKVRELLP